jgi:hypothetical protein
MDYQKVYRQIVERARDRVLEGYKEKHHIVPKCMGGSNEHSNLVHLTAREHFLCHWLLHRAHPDSFKLFYAFKAMCNVKNKYQKTRYIPSSRIVSYVREKHKNWLKENSNFKGRSTKGELNGFYGKKHKPETIEYFKTSRKESTLGEKNGMWGKHHSEESNQARRLKVKGKPNTKVAIALTGRIHPKTECPYCKKVGGESAMKRWHFKNCKLKVIL